MRTSSSSPLAGIPQRCLQGLCAKPSCILHGFHTECTSCVRHVRIPASLCRWHGLSDTWHSWMMSGQAAGAAGAFAGFAGVGIAAKTAAPAAALMTSSAGELDSLWRSLGGASLVSASCPCPPPPSPSFHSPPALRPPLSLTSSSLALRVLWSCLSSFADSRAAHE